MKFFAKNKKKILISLFWAILFIVGVCNMYKPLPEGINKKWQSHNVSNDEVRFLADTTYVNSEEKIIHDQEIFDEVLKMITSAHSYILVDMFLWNDYLGKGSEPYRKLSKEVTEALIAKKKENPSMRITVISDPINTSYFGNQSSYFTNMQKEGIQVIFTNLPSLRDSNPIFSSLWRVFVYPFDILHYLVFETSYTFRIFPNIINSGGEKVTFRSLANLLNFKANHRKLIVTDRMKEDGTISLVSLITSANPHDGSSSHSNVALVVSGGLGKDLMDSEEVVAKLSSSSVKPLILKEENPSGNIGVSLLTDKAIHDEVISILKQTQRGDSVHLLMFYLSDGQIVNELLEASNRGVEVQIILDPNKDAFGMKKNGIPNRQVAHHLTSKSNGAVKIRWCLTHGEQCHGKLLIVRQEHRYTMLLGSANYTRRNIGGYNLETNVMAQSDTPFDGWNDAWKYFETLWNNEGILFSGDYEVYEDTSLIKRVVAYIMERTGLGTF